MSGLRRREDFEREEDERLAPYAVRSGESMGRLHPEASHAYRTDFQRDRDRVVHCRAFRRLEYKTQVFVYHEGDHYRNRLTHTIENAQIARAIARVLCLNEDLAETVALAHDLGHTPFAHAGERVLNELMGDHGGFDHNRQTLRIVDLLEERYPGFMGLNLTSETREGLLKHGCDWSHPTAIPELGEQPSLEAQVANLADEIAYSNHDLDDGLASGILELGALREISLWRDAQDEVREQFGELSPRLERDQVIIRLINRLVTDVVEASHARLVAHAPASVSDLRSRKDRLLAFSPVIEEAKQELKSFLREKFYFHPRISKTTKRADHIMRQLYDHYSRNSDQMPPALRQRLDLDGTERVTADYIAGMTDRYALAAHAKLADSEPRH